MAKIYETAEDFKRDTLKEQADALHTKAMHQGSDSVWLIGLSFLADLYHERKPETRGWLRYASGLAVAGGIIQAVRSWITHSEARDVERERQHMGPERVILPPEGTPSVKETACCARERIRNRFYPKTVFDYVEKPDGPETPAR